MDDHVAIYSRFDIHGEIQWPSEEGKYFRRAGWRLIRAESIPTDTPSRILASVVQRGGRTALRTAVLAVRFAPDVDCDAVGDLLDKHGLVLVRKLGFGNNYTVSVAGTGVVDTTPVAEMLKLLPGCEAAEPVFVEQIGER